MTTDSHGAGLVERLQAEIELQKNLRGDYIYKGQPDPLLVDCLAALSPPSPDREAVIRAGRDLIKRLDNIDVSSAVLEAGGTHWDDIRFTTNDLAEALALLEQEG